MKYLKMRFLLLILFLFPSINFSQEGDAPETAWKWYYTVSFDGTGLASGVYFYTIEAGNFKDSKKMVLIK